MINRKQKETLIYRHKHRDYKGNTNGKKSIMPPVDFLGGTCLIYLADLSDSEVDRLWELENRNDYVLRKEQKRKARLPPKFKGIRE